MILNFFKESAINELISYSGSTREINSTEGKLGESEKLRLEKVTKSIKE